MSGYRYSETDLNRVNDFVEHLLSRPGVKSEPLPSGERMIISFLEQNLPELKTAFKDSRFFPHLGLTQVMELIAENLYTRVSGTVLPVINRFIDNTDFSFFDRLSESGTTSDRFRKEKFHEFIQTILKNRDSRLNMNCVLNIFNPGVMEKYTGEIFRRRDYLYNELVRVQKLNIDSREYTVFLKTMLLVKNAVYLSFPDGQNEPVNEKFFLKGDRVRINPEAYTLSAVKNLAPLLPGIPEMLIRLAVKSNFTADMTDEDEPAARLIFILSGRFQNYRHCLTIERGAETPDKSWFRLAAKNAGHFGYDAGILEALYMIAGDNNW